MDDRPAERLFVHCEVGIWGHAVHADVQAAYRRWEAQHGRVVAQFTKGQNPWNPWTEHYSALQAEVPDADDARTQLNHALLSRLDEADSLLIAGEASSHCVRARVEHIADHLPGSRPERITLRTDCMSPVAGFTVQHGAFLADMRSRGVRLATAAEVLVTLQAHAAA